VQVCNLQFNTVHIAHIILCRSGAVHYTANVTHIIKRLDAIISASQFWVGYTADSDGALLAADGSDSAYIESRVAGNIAAGGCVYGNKMDSDMSLSDETFR